MNTVRIEVYGASGNWEIWTTIPAQPAYNIRNQLVAAVNSNTAKYASKRIARAVDAQTGMLIDMEFGV